MSEKMPNYFVGVISQDEVSVAEGPALEQPMTVKRRRLLPSPRRKPVHPPEMNSNVDQTPSPQPSTSRFVDFLSSTPTSVRSEEDSETQPSASRDSMGSKRSPRKLSYSTFDSRLEEQVNMGSDIESEDEGGDEFVFDIPTRQLIGALNMVEDMTAILEEAPAKEDGVAAVGEDGESTSGPASGPAASPEDSAGPSCGPEIFDFIWEPLPQPPVDPNSRREKFTSPYGPVATINDPYEIFTAVWDYNIMQMIAVETNRYAEQNILKKIEDGSLDGNSRLLHWKDTNVDELYVFFALILATGVVIKSDLSEYWSVNQNIFDTPYFGAYMPYNRFIALGSMLHFVNNLAIDFNTLSTSEARIYKIAPIVNHLNERFQANYRLGQCVALDESLTQWKGWLNISQYIKNKAASRGVKSYELCDSRSGYLWRFKIHAGRDYGDNEYGYITSLVLQLLSGLEYKGHTIFMDNYYNSPMLARLLKSQGFDCVGTLRLNRQYVPAQIKSLMHGSLGAGSVHGCTSGDVDVVVWKDKNIVPLISTYHGASSFSRFNRVKPNLVHDYNVRMGGVDKKDQMLSAYPVERKRTAMWYKKVFRRLLNASVLNSYIIHKENPFTPESPRLNHRQFRKALVLSMLEKHSKPSKMVQTRTRQTGRVIFPEVFKRHLPEQLPILDSRRRRRGRCVLCKKRGTTCCPGCNVILCLKECFGKYHTVENI